MRRILLALGFELDDETIIVPSWRGDVEHYSDIAEEIARFYGYNNIPCTLMRGQTTSGGYSDAQKEEILAILTKKEYGQFMDYVQAKDPNAFVTISNVKRVVGSWNTPKRRTYF